MKWEYKSIRYEATGSFSMKVGGDDQPDKMLNQMGEDGWELVATLHPTTSSAINLFIFKRPMPVKTR
jgi:hypothetical protein